MFHFSTFALYLYAFKVKYPCGWVAPFRDPEIAAWLPAPSGLSQVPTSFIASRHQDIHRVPLSLGHQPDAAITPRRVLPALPDWLSPGSRKDGRPDATQAAHSRDRPVLHVHGICAFGAALLRDPFRLGAGQIDRNPGIIPSTALLSLCSLIASSIYFFTHARSIVRPPCGGLITGRAW